MASKPGLTVKIFFRRGSQTDQGAVFAEAVKRRKKPVESVREVLNREELPESEVFATARVAFGQTPAGLLKACSRLMELMIIPKTYPFSAI